MGGKQTGGNRRSQQNDSTRTLTETIMSEVAENSGGAPMDPQMRDVLESMVNFFTHGDSGSRPAFEANIRPTSAGGGRAGTGAA